LTFEDTKFSSPSTGLEPMRVKFWGVRGSTPTPQAENMRYGGNTSCVEVRVGEQLYIFDCGTGFRVLGQQLQDEFGEKKLPLCAHVFVSHFHWDHIQGIPFFRPLYDRADSQFLFHCSSRLRSLKQVMDEQMASPYFPSISARCRRNRSFTTSIVAGWTWKAESKFRARGSITLRAAWASGWKPKMACWLRH